ncbi:hypothetical protein TOL_1131 [Thalassolituus oleivorans MIL-1]|uniref:Uncharacterized protein n=1 Tax=Thalassolituus oleivorans MIL-1 TaxID=1298593 RepID=M5DNP0_9GAMM|nr:hypothetical protein TOL_1131 [Thalassolituus oleivorans MIL-1]
MPDFGIDRLHFFIADLLGIAHYSRRGLVYVGNWIGNRDRGTHQFSLVCLRYLGAQAASE